MGEYKKSKNKVALEEFGVSDVSIYHTCIGYVHSKYSVM